MKIFGKKKTHVETTTPTTKSHEDSHSLPKSEQNQEQERTQPTTDPTSSFSIPSYFSPDFFRFHSTLQDSHTPISKKQDAGTDVEIEKLRLQDPSTLNAKQRRILRRYLDRTGDILHSQDDSFLSTTPQTRDGHGTDKNLQLSIHPKEEERGGMKMEDSLLSTRDKPCASDTSIHTTSVSTTQEEKTLEALPTTQTVDTDNIHPEKQSVQLPNIASTQDLLQQLQGLNAKERRKLLRQYSILQQQEQQEKIQPKGDDDPTTVDTSNTNHGIDSSHTIAIHGKIDKNIVKDLAKRVGEERQKLEAEKVHEKKQQKRQKPLQQQQPQPQHDAQQQEEEKCMKDSSKKKKRKLESNQEEPTSNTGTTTAFNDTKHTNKKPYVPQNMTPVDNTKNPKVIPENNTGLDPSSQKRKNSKSCKDFSLLPPQERERREKQRQSQQEAAARRIAEAEFNGNNASRRQHKHPLNSERRRANRRKPSGKAARLMLKQTKKIN